MSRIHEALKKAEQERAAAQGETAHSSLAMPEAPEIPMPSMTEHSAVDSLRPLNSGGVPLTSAMPSFASPFSLDALLARCPQVPWSPDAKTMLFFNGDDNAPGTEEFRTVFLTSGPGRERNLRIACSRPCERKLVRLGKGRPGSLQRAIVRQRLLYQLVDRLGTEQ